MEEKVNAQEKRGRKWYWLLVLLPVLLILAGAAVWAAGTFFGLSRLPVPNNVSAENVGLHELRISWDSSPKIQQYQVILSTEEFTREKLIENGWQDGPYDVSIVENAAEITIHSLLPDTDYYIAVAACREGKEKITCSDPSETVKIHTSSLEVGRATDLTAEEVTDRQIKLKWTDWTTSEKNQDHTDIDITYTLLCTALPTGNSTEADRTIVQEALREPAYIITDAAPFTRYAYTVVVNALIDGKVVSGESSEALEVLTKPEAVAGLDARADGTSSLAVTWKPYELTPGTEAVVTYSLYGSDQENAEFTLLDENMTDTAYTETGLTENQTRYYYVVAHILLEGEKYAGMACQPVSATTNPPVTAPPSPPAPPPSSGNSSPSGGATGGKYAQARTVSQQIAAGITGNSDLEKISQAASAVAGYCANASYTTNGSDYATAYGVFIKGEYSCAGATRALGMVLECMGYSWQHANENQWTHQWVIVTMDGEPGWADGQIGWAGYGTHPLA